MKKIILFIVLMFCGSVYAAAPGGTCSLNRTSGTAPLSVFDDCSAITGVTMHTGDFRRSWGDTATGTWTYGTRAGQSKNYSEGMFGAHVYETAGTYTVSRVICNSSNECAQSTATVTVTAADTTWATNTMCVANGSTPVAGSGGCPSGSTVRESGDFDATLVAALGANGCGTGIVCKRILFKGGDTFEVSDNGPVAVAGPGYIGSYGTGKATLRSVADNLNTLGFNAVSDWRVVDLIIDGNNTDASRGVNLEYGSVNNSIRTLVLRVDFSRLMWGVGDGTGSEWVVADSTFGAVSTNASILSAYGSYAGVTVTEDNSLAYSAYIGNFFDIGVVNPQSTHAIRNSHMNKTVIANNTINAGRLTALDLQAPEFATGSYSEYVILSDNKIIGNASSAGLSGFGAPGGTDGRIRNVVAERNWFVGGTASGEYFQLLPATDVTIRNNIFDGTASTVNMVAIIIDTGGGATIAPNNINIYNNTAYTTKTGSFSMVRVAVDTATNITAMNNLAYAPNATASYSNEEAFPVVMDVITGAAAPTVSNNSTATSGSDQVKATNPFLATPSTSNLTTFQPSTAYADDGGTAQYPAQNSDVLSCFDLTGANRIGAVVPRAQASCRSAP